MKPARFLIQALVLGALLASVPTLAADVPQQAPGQQAKPSHNIAPVWREVRSGESGFTTTRGVETGVLIQSGGETWRKMRNGPITLYGGILLCVAVIVVGIFYMWRGPIKLREAPTGRLIERFNLLERVAHWIMAGCFLVLALSGLTLLFGKHVLLPVFGYTLFSWVAVILKNLHNFVGPLFLLSVIVSFFIFAKENIWAAADAEWIKKAGGLLSGEHVSTGRFNLGEKFWFWIGVVLLGLTLGVTGLVMDFPNFEQGRSLMQTVNIIHAAGAIIFICLSVGHIYLGTIGTEGALDAMRTGYVDEAWAREHHELWYQNEKHKSVEPTGTAATAHS